MGVIIGSIQIATKTKSAWDTQAPVLLAGQAIAEVDGAKTRIKVGNGATGYAALKYITVKDSDDVSEGSANLFYTAGRFNDAFAAKTTNNLTEGGTNLYYTQARFDSALAAKSTSDLTEGTNLYYTQARADARIQAAKNIAYGVAGLDAGGLIYAAQLPSFVDDVLEYANVAAFPVTGESGKIYVPADTNKTYRWSGSAYVEISASPGSTDAVTEGVTNLYHTTARVHTLGDARYSVLAHTHTFASLTSKPTTLEGFGITGGTLSGALYGTDIGLSGFIQAGYFQTASNPATSGGVRLGTQVAIRARNVANTANIPLIESSSADKVWIDSGGAGTVLGGALSGTSATFSGDLSVGVSAAYTILNYKFITVSAPTGGGLVMQKNGVTKGTFYNANDNVFADSIGDFVFGTGSIFSGTERFRIRSSGVKVSGFNGAAGYGFVIDSISDTGTQYMAEFTRIGVQAGYIASTGSTTVGIYNTSDYRMKEDIRDFSGIDKLKNIMFYDFKWKTKEANRDYGVIAHELQKTLPLAVNGEKDGKYNQAVDYVKLIPIIGKALKEALARIEQLENKYEN